MAKHYVEHEQQVVSSDIPSEAQETLAGFLEGHIGVLHSSEYIPGSARMSEDTGRKFTEILIKKHRRRSK